MVIHILQERKCSFPDGNVYLQTCDGVWCQTLNNFTKAARRHQSLLLSNLLQSHCMQSGLRVNVIFRLRFLFKRTMKLTQRINQQTATAVQFQISIIYHRFGLLSHLREHMCPGESMWPKRWKTIHSEGLLLGPLCQTALQSKEKKQSMYVAWRR